MQASERMEVACRLLGSVVSVEAPHALASCVGTALGRLPSLRGSASQPGEVGLTSTLAPGGNPISIRLTPATAGWRVELEGRHFSAADEEEAVVRLQETLLESASSRAGDTLLFRGSIVARGSQCLLIVGDRG